MESNAKFHFVRFCGYIFSGIIHKEWLKFIFQNAKKIVGKIV